jgi:hypothetical protein
MSATEIAADRAATDLLLHLLLRLHTACYTMRQVAASPSAMRSKMHACHRTCRAFPLRHYTVSTTSMLLRAL